MSQTPQDTHMQTIREKSDTEGEREKNRIKNR